MNIVFLFQHGFMCQKDSFIFKFFNIIWDSDKYCSKYLYAVEVSPFWSVSFVEVSVAFFCRY